ncbi:MAG: hypothetical protein R2939_05555 [Kofleriaceae bacterium]
MPVLMVAAYLALISTSDVSGWVTVAVLLVMGVVTLLWLLFRELSVHAALTRAAAIGLPDEVLARADAELARRWTRATRAPFQVYRAIGHELRGDFAAALAALAEVDARALAGGRRGWGLLAARTEIAARLELGEIAAARAAFDQHFAAPPASTTVVGRELAARLRLAEGDAAGAAPELQALARDVRLGPAARAVALLCVARCGDALGDAAGAARDRAAAAALAPQTWAGAAA